MSDSINFSWYLMFWMSAHLGDERTFWKTMTPARCGQLYKEYSRMISLAKKQPQKSGGSLSAYLMGGE